MEPVMPTEVRLASTCTAVGGALLFLLSPGMIFAGLFASLHALLAGLLFLGLGVLGMSASKQIDKRRSISRTLGLVWGGTVAAGTSVTMLATLREPEFDLAAVIISGTFAVLAFSVIVALLLPSTSRWLAVTKVPADCQEAG